MSHSFENSSSLSSCHHDPKKNILYITFKSGQTHAYKDCPASHFEGLKSAKSAGAYFHLHIRDKYENEKQ